MEAKEEEADKEPLTMKMLRKRNLFVVKQHLAVLIRSLTSTEVSTALRPFYFSVHPDLFGQHPKERAINETSLQQLSSVLQSLQTAKYLPPVTLPFYIKNRFVPIYYHQINLEILCFSDRNNQHEAARLIKIYLKGRDLASAIVNILKACDLPTNHVQQYIKAEPQRATGFQTENIRQDGNEWIRVKYQNEYDFTKLNKNHPLYATFVMQQKMKEARGALRDGAHVGNIKALFRLKQWLELHFEDALAKATSGSASKEEIQRLKVEMIEKSKLKDIRWECGWNSQHFRGCLLSLKSLMEQHPQHMRQLEDQILVFSYFTGISLDGHLMLFSGEVRHNWLDFIKNIRKHKLALGRVPFYEKSLSHVLRNIKVSRRKFMPDMKVSEYEINLKQLTTAVSDYFGRNSLPKNWPNSMDHYEIVVESEAGPMMVSPTGQFIVPSSIPGPLLINFISTNFDDANERIDHYKKDKVMEKSLHRRCMEELHLAALLKDDNITPELMIQFCQKLVDHKTDLESVIKGMHVNVSTYYSVLSDGVVCIPWNFDL
ncbi:hypothetical protein HUJ04_006307 [Dendroctonus ponderosae]|nr:hypothetical protein HUJ04_006307 [Dendroctonus ponderosae]